MRKAVYFLAFFLFLGYFSMAQVRRAKNQPNYDYQRIHFGFLIGFNQFSFKTEPIANLSETDSILSVNSANSKGFSLMIISDLRLSNHLNLRFEPGLSYLQRDLIYTLDYQVSNQFVEERRSVESTLVELPVLIKFSSNRVNNHRAYLIGGVKYNIDMSSQKDVEVKELFKLKQTDYAVEYGVGWDFYFEYFKFSPQIKASYGFNNLLVPDGSVFTNSIERINNRAVYLNFTFE